MRRIHFLLLALLAGGCASREPGTPPNVRAASSLVFDTPIAMAEPPIDLSRDTRGNAALYGFEDTSTTAYYIHTENRETTDFTDRYERRSYVDKVGTIRR